jgi:hypothetical protein
MTHATNSFSLSLGRITLKASSTEKPSATFANESPSIHPSGHFARASTSCTRQQLSSETSSPLSRCSALNALLRKLLDAWQWERAEGGPAWLNHHLAALTNNDISCAVAAAATIAGGRKQRDFSPTCVSCFRGENLSITVDVAADKTRAARL